MLTWRYRFSGNPHNLEDMADKGKKSSKPIPVFLEIRHGKQGRCLVAKASFPDGKSYDMYRTGYYSVNEQEDKVKAQDEIRGSLMHAEVYLRSKGVKISVIEAIV